MLYSINSKKILILFFLVYSSFIYAQKIYTGKFRYISPTPDSKYNSPATNIIIKFSDAFSNYNIDNSVIVEGSKSGKHQGKIILTEENKTLIFQPYNSFLEGETVTVKLTKNLKSISGVVIPGLIFTFKISKIDLNKKIMNDPKLYSNLLQKYFQINIKKLQKVNLEHQKQVNKETFTIQKDSLPSDFPSFGIDSVNNPAPGYIFYAPILFPGWESAYMIISDNYGTPIFYRKMQGAVFDFKKLDNGYLTYFELGPDKYYIMDISYNVIDSLYMQNGYLTDLHDIVVLNNKHFLLMSSDYEHVDMDTVVAGGDSNATVIGVVIQELDENKNVVFQWRTWDHYKITDATYDINLLGSTIDYAHCNSIQIDTDGNILLSTRHLDEVTKIDRQTGEIIWRWGGKYCKNNQFTFINDPIGFSHQHNVRRIPNGNITLFDNGNLHYPQYSRVCEYQIDEKNKLATLIWEYKNNPTTFSNAMGDAERLDNHNTFIGWGSGQNPAISEVRADGTITYFQTMPATLINYRAFKFPWKTNLIKTTPEELSFGYVSVGSSKIDSLFIINNSAVEIQINGILNRDSAFIMLTSIPISIRPYDSTLVYIMFKPYLNENFFDELNLQWNTEEQRIAQVVKLLGTTVTSVETVPNGFDFHLTQNYPNPFNPTTKIEYTIPKASFVTLKVYDVLGREVTTLVNEGKSAGNYNVEFNGNGLSSGIYFYKIQAGNFSTVKKMILMK